MDENLELSLLYDIYGSLLTSKQKDIFEEYYLYNLSLREIAENKKISYQAVRDSINSSKELLRNYESNIGMLKFRNKLERNGINATVRREMGRDIDGACGQLRKSYMDNELVLLE